MSYPVIAAFAVSGVAAATFTYRYLIKKTGKSSTLLNYDGDSEEDIYSECPEASFPYNKDHYLASDAFACFIDDTISSNKLKHRRELAGFGQFVNIENTPRGYR